MYRLKKIEIYASEIAAYLNTLLLGSDIVIHYPSSTDNLAENTIVFFNDIKKFQAISEKDLQSMLVIIPSKDFIKKESPNISYIISENPLIDFISVVNEYFTENTSFFIASSAKIDKHARIGRNVLIGENTVIGADVSIGENAQIFNNVVIKGNVEIGNNCVIKDNATIGSTGYNFVVDKNGKHIVYPNIGKIIIEDDVWIGSNSTIESPSFENTRIHKLVKIDDLVHVGYNCVIGKETFITAGVVISRNVKIGEGSSILLNSTIRENINIGNNVIVGIGSVVISNIENNSVYVGNPAHFFKQN